MMDKKEILKFTKEFLIKEENIEFALLFGSVVSGKNSNMSDIDVGIYLKNDIDLLKFGDISANLEKILRRKVDLLILNSLYNKNPLLAYKIVTNYNLIFERNSENLLNFKYRSYLEYFDTEKLRKSINEAFYRRIKAKKFGSRNYA